MIQSASLLLSSGRELDVDFEYEPPSGDGWHAPRHRGQINLVRVRERGIEALTSDREEAEILAFWEPRTPYEHNYGNDG